MLTKIGNMNKYKNLNEDDFIYNLNVNPKSLLIYKGDDFQKLLLRYSLILNSFSICSFKKDYWKEFNFKILLQIITNPFFLKKIKCIVLDSMTNVT